MPVSAGFLTDSSVTAYTARNTPFPPSHNGVSRHTMASGKSSLITVTGSSGILTRFPIIPLRLFATQDALKQIVDRNYKRRTGKSQCPVCCMSGLLQTLPEHTEQIPLFFRQFRKNLTGSGTLLCVHRVSFHNL